MAASTVKIGDNGIIQIGPETTYGTATAAYVPQHSRAATLGFRRDNLLPSPRLGQTPGVREYGVPFADGEIVLAYDNSRAVIGDLLATAGNLATNDYTIGSSTAVDEDSLSQWIDYGGYAIQYTGGILNSLRFEFQPDSPIVVTASFLGRNATKVTPGTYTKPDITGVVWESDISAITIGAVPMCSLAGTVEVQFPVEGTDRHCLGGSFIKQPVRLLPIVTTGSLTVELDDSTGADSEAILDLYLAGTTIGDSVIGDFTLSNCYMTGETPALGEGITQFPINFTAENLIITTIA